MLGGEASLGRVGLRQWVVQVLYRRLEGKIREWNLIQLNNRQFIIVSYLGKAK